MKKGAIWVSAILYVLIILIVMIIVLQAGIPFIRGLSERNTLSKIQDTMSGLDEQVQQIASEGQGSQRIVPLQIVDGELKVEDQKLRWKYETDNKLVESKSRVELGNIVIASGVDVTAATSGNFFILENSRIRINASKIGSATSFASINTSGIINNVRFKETSGQTNGTFTFYVNDSSSLTGNGYTLLEKEGSGLTQAVVRAHINNTLMSYDLIFTLDDKADFFRVAVEKFRRK